MGEGDSPILAIVREKLVLYIWEIMGPALVYDSWPGGGGGWGKTHLSCGQLEDLGVFEIASSIKKMVIFPIEMGRKSMGQFVFALDGSRESRLQGQECVSWFLGAICV